jgi:hypothetical protein
MSGFTRQRFATFPRFSGCRVTKGTPGNMPTSEAAFTFDTEAFDTDAYHDLSSNTERLTVPSTGFFLVTAGLDAATAVDENFYIYIQLNGSGVGSPLARPGKSVGVGSGAYIAFPMSLTTADFVTLRCSATAADALSRIFFAIHHIGN